MAGSGVSRAQENKAIRQKALREQLAAQGHVQHVVEMIDKIADLDAVFEIGDISRLKTACELKLKLINKYLPDTKQIESSLDVSGDVTHSLVQVEFIEHHESDDG
jgi:hypothetical protein